MIKVVFCPSGWNDTSLPDTALLSPLYHLNILTMYLYPIQWESQDRGYLHENTKNRPWFWIYSIYFLLGASVCFLQHNHTPMLLYIPLHQYRPPDECVPPHSNRRGIKGGKQKRYKHSTVKGTSWVAWRKKISLFSVIGKYFKRKILWQKSIKSAHHTPRKSKFRGTKKDIWNLTCWLYLKTPILYW